jgi:hypothetical protein
MIFLEILGAWFLADFLTGVVHWYEDRMLTDDSRFKFLREAAADNELHHNYPYALCRVSFWENINTSAVITLPLSLILFLIDAPMILWLAVFFATFGNLIHRFAHERFVRVTKWIREVQRMGLFLSFRHHASHHYLRGETLMREDASKNYCAMTDWLNPILDGIKFWKLLEFILRR